MSDKKHTSQDPLGNTWKVYTIIFLRITLPACDEGPSICSLILTIGSLFLIVASLPLSLFCVVKVVQVWRVWIRREIQLSLCRNMREQSYSGLVGSLLGVQGGQGSSSSILSWTFMRRLI